MIAGRWVAVSVLGVASAWAQVPGAVYGGGVPRTYGSPSGFGNVLYPGMGSAPPQLPGAVNGIGFPARLGATIGGFPPGYGGVGPGFGGVYPPGFGRTRTVVVPFGVPVFAGGYGPYVQPPQETNVTIVMPPQPTPQVVINHHYVAETARPVIRDYSQAPPPEPSSEMRSYQAPGPTPSEPERPRVERPKAERPTAAVPRREAEPAPARKEQDEANLYLIAFKDGMIHSAVGYAVEGSTLSYVTGKGSTNRVPLEQVDRALTERLNRERGVEFRVGR